MQDIDGYKMKKYPRGSILVTAFIKTGMTGRIDCSKKILLKESCYLHCTQPHLPLYALPVPMQREHVVSLDEVVPVSLILPVYSLFSV